MWAGSGAGYRQFGGMKGRAKGGFEAISVSQFGLLNRARSARSVAVFAFAGEVVVVLGVDLLVTSVGMMSDEAVASKSPWLSRVAFEPSFGCLVCSVHFPGGAVTGSIVRTSIHQPC